MRVLLFAFYYKFNIEVHPGIGVLSAALKKRGHDTELQPYFYLDEKVFTKKVEEFKPDMIGISATHMAVSQVKRLASFLKKITDVPITLGGVFPILEPERALSIDGIDAVCFGEGVEGIIEFVENNHPASNYLYKDGRKGKMKKWSNAPICTLDYDVFFNAMPNKNRTKKLDYWTCFTCEFGCSFCSSKNFRKIVGLKGKPRQTHEIAIERLKELVDKTQCEKIHFRDPLFLGINEKKWVVEFLKLYKKEVGKKYTCNLRADTVDEEMVSILKETGCHTIKMGLESGDEHMRNVILLKGETDKEYEKSCDLINKSGIRLSLNAMIGLPYETMETAEKTFDMLRSLKSQKTFLHIFQPWPGLSLDKRINDCIKYITSQALYDEKVAGRFVNEIMEGFKYDKQKADAETIEFPVLDQPQFPYKLSVDMQREFQKILMGGV